MKIVARIATLKEEGLENLDLKILDSKEISVGNMNIAKDKNNELPGYNEMI